MLIFRQQFNKADTAFRSGRTAFFDKGPQLNFGVKVDKFLSLYSKYRNGFMIDYFVLKVMIILNNVPKAVDTRRGPAFIDILAFT